MDKLTITVVLTALWLGGMHLTDICARVLDGRHFQLPPHFERYTFFFISFISIGLYLNCCNQSKNLIIHIAASIPLPLITCGLYLYMLTITDAIFQNQIQIGHMIGSLSTMFLSVLLIPDAWYILVPMQIITICASYLLRDTPESVPISV